MVNPEQNESNLANTMYSPALSNTETVFSTDWFAIELQTFVQTPEFKYEPYYRMIVPDSVLVLATTSDEQVILVKQFRPAIGAITLELPAGAVDPGEAPEDAAKRELLEETGYVCNDWKQLGSGRLMASRLDSRQFAFYGSGAILDPSFERKEPIDVVLTDPSQLKRLALTGEFGQFPAFALLVLADWRVGTSFTSPDQTKFQFPAGATKS